ncbi:MAG TPA: mechanosensitive ion channel domain-containing protein, partial [Methylomirabilota bacterium]|nr:mechanosensitive ion channel domain-containing protein [Methylomirabilota bacterium]
MNETNQTDSSFLEGLLNDPLQHPIVRLGEFDLTLLAILKIIVFLALVVLAEMLLRRYILQQALKRTRLEPSIQYGISRMLGYAFIAFGFYVVIVNFGIDLTSLAVFAGALGVGIGFGLQNVISNFMSGLIILMERPIALGDRVEVGGVAGRVTRIALRSTTVLTNDNISIIVPNSDFISTPVTNWSHGDPKVRMRLPLGVAYGSDVEKLKRVLIEVAEAHPHVLKEPAPAVFFIGF